MKVTCCARCAGNPLVCPSVDSDGNWQATAATPEPASCLGFGMRAFTLPENCLVRNMAAMYSFSAQARLASHLLIPLSDYNPDPALATMLLRAGSQPPTARQQNLCELATREG